MDTLQQNELLRNMPFRDDGTIDLMELGRRQLESMVNQIDLCQDFGHGSSRIYAATGSSSAAGFVRSKKASMAFAGIW